MDKKSDIDFFVVTAPNRLWITKAIMVLLKKTIFFNSYKYFCVNYLISQERLEIDEKNIFSATELITVIPTYGSDVYQELFKANHWINRYYPNYPFGYQNGIPENQPGVVKKVIEKGLSGKLGNTLDDLFMKIAIDKAQNKYSKKFSPEEFEVAFKATKYASKWHGNNYQKKIIDLFNYKINEFQIKNNVEII